MDIVGNFSRSVIIENIPNDFDEDRLIDIFRQAGAVTRFTIIDDIETQNFKGSASCEYYHPSMALNAVEMFNNMNYKGHQLSVVLENTNFGHGTGEHIPDSVISQAVASLPSYQMYELMKQMKLCIQNNPNEARNMLLQNPQLAYALLQAQIVMKIVDPKVAIAMLNRSHEQIPNTASASQQQQQQQQQQQAPNPMPFQNYTENVRHISVFPDLPLSQQSINNSAGDPFRPVSGSQVPVFPNAHDQPVPINRPELNNFNPQQNNPKVEATNQPSLFDSQNEKEKAALIMQVLKLSDHQIALLPEDQRRSILILKEQLNRS